MLEGYQKKENFVTCNWTVIFQFISMGSESKRIGGGKEGKEKSRHSTTKTSHQGIKEESWLINSSTACRPLEQEF